MLRFLIYILAFAISSPIYAQLGGSASMSFLKLSSSTQQKALGGYQTSRSCQDVSMLLANPALLADSIADWVSVGYTNYYAGIQGGTGAYAKEVRHGVLGFGVQYLNYGSFDSYDATGQALGDFKATDLAIQASYAITHKVYALGLSMKFAQSSIESYHSSALLFDIGGLFRHPSKDFQLAWLVKNIGFRLSSYAGETDFDSPLDIQLSMSLKPQHMPIRLYLTAHHLHDFDIAYTNPTLSGQVDALGNPLQEELGFADKLARHLAIGGEFVLGKNLSVQMGYNVLKRREMTLEGIAGTVGFSWGLVFRTERWQASYSRDAAFIGNGISSFSISIAPAKWSKKKRVIQ